MKILRSGVTLNKFLVNSAILPRNIDPIACATGIPQMLLEKGIKNVKVKGCYSCGEEGKVVFVAEAQTKESLLEALGKINLPVASVLRAEEVKPQLDYRCPLCGMDFETEEDLIEHQKRQHTQ
jgi:hypothetical protein